MGIIHSCAPDILHPGPNLGAHGWVIESAASGLVTAHTECFLRNWSSRSRPFVQHHGVSVANIHIVRKFPLTRLVDWFCEHSVD